MIRRAPLVRSSAGLAMSRGVSGALTVLASVVVARAAGISTLGAFGLALTAGVYASVIADAGVSAYLVPALGSSGRDRWRGIWAEVTRFELRSVVPLACIFLLAVGLLTHGPERLALLAATPWWLLIRFNGAARSVFTVAERVGAEATATVVEAAVTLTAISLVLLRSDSPAAATLCLSAGALAGLALRLRGLRTLGVGGGRPQAGVGRLTRAALPFAGVTILTTLYLRIDVVLLALLSTTRELGLYQAPVRLVTGLIILPDALATVLLGRAARAPDGDDVRRRQQQLLSLGVPVGIGLVVLCVLAGKPFLGALYGDDFRQAWLALTLLVATVPIGLVATMNGNALTARGLQKTRVACLAVASVVAVAAGVPAIALWGYDGAAAVSVLNEVVLVAAYAIALTAAAGRRALVLPRPGFV